MRSSQNEQRRTPLERSSVTRKHLALPLVRKNGGELFGDGIRVILRETRIDDRPKRRIIASADPFQNPDLIITFPATINHSNLASPKENQPKDESERLPSRILLRFRREPLEEIHEGLVIHEHLPLGAGVRNLGPPPAEQPFTQFLSRFR